MLHCLYGGTECMGGPESLGWTQGSRSLGQRIRIHRSVSLKLGAVRPPMSDSQHQIHNVTSSNSKQYVSYLCPLFVKKDTKPLRADHGHSLHATLDLCTSNLKPRRESFRSWPWQFLLRLLFAMLILSLIFIPKGRQRIKLNESPFYSVRTPFLSATAKAVKITILRSDREYPNGIRCVIIAGDGTSLVDHFFPAVPFELLLPNKSGPFIDCVPRCCCSDEIPNAFSLHSFSNTGDPWVNPTFGDPWYSGNADFLLAQFCVHNVQTVSCEISSEIICTYNVIYQSVKSSAPVVRVPSRSGVSHTMSRTSTICIALVHNSKLCPTLVSLCVVVLMNYVTELGGIGKLNKCQPSHCGSSLDPGSFIQWISGFTNQNKNWQAYTMIAWAEDKSTMPRTVTFALCLGDSRVIDDCRLSLVMFICCIVSSVHWMTDYKLVRQIYRQKNNVFDGIKASLQWNSCGFEPFSVDLLSLLRLYQQCY